MENFELNCFKLPWLILHLTGRFIFTFLTLWTHASFYKYILCIYNSILDNTNVVNHSQILLLFFYFSICFMAALNFSRFNIDLFLLPGCRYHQQELNLQSLVEEKAQLLRTLMVTTIVVTNQTG